MPTVTFREAINQAMSEEMEKNKDVFLMGEEVAQYNGAYKVSMGMLDRFGPERVIDTPITENGFCGLGIGSAMVGLRPIIEMMTFNFAILALDQIINHAAKMLYMSGGQYNIPMVIRGPGGAAHMLACQHSQATEWIYANVPGLKVVVPSTPKDAKGLLKTAIRDNDPVIFIESETMYGMKGEIPEGEYLIPLKNGDIKHEGKDCTVVTWGRTVHTVLRAVESLAKEGIEAEVVDPRTLRPLDLNIILESVKKTNRLIIVEEGWPFGGIGSQIAYEVQKKIFDYLDAPVERVTSADVPMPYAGNLEKEALPNERKIMDAIKQVCYVS